MSRNNKSRLLIGFLVGSIVGFCVVYFFALPQEQTSDLPAKEDQEIMEVTLNNQQPQTIETADQQFDSIPVSEDWKELLNPRYVMGKFNATDHPDIVAVPSALTDGDGQYFLHQQALDSFVVMHTAAKRDGIKLEIVSAFRNFNRQKAIWEAKWNGHRLLEGKENAKTTYPNAADRARAILRYSSMPGSSRHHWGTDLDLNNLNNSYFEKGEGLKVYEWLLSNAQKYGFCQPYTEKGTDRPHGYEEEKWHWSFMPLSAKLTAFAEQQLKDQDIEGFAGSESAELIGVVEHYVLGINKKCWQ